MVAAYVIDKRSEVKMFDYVVWTGNGRVVVCVRWYDGMLSASPITAHDDSGDGDPFNFF